MKNYHSITIQELQSFMDALKQNAKHEQFDFEVKKGGNSLDEGQVCGMLNSDGGIILVGVGERDPAGSGYDLHPFQDVPGEIGKIKTQIEKIKAVNLEIKGEFDTHCIVEPFTYNGGNYIAVKINSSDAGFVFEGRFYTRRNHAKEYLKTRHDLLDFIEKTRNYESFLVYIEEFRSKMIDLSAFIAGAGSPEEKFTILESTEIEHAIELLKSKQHCLESDIPFDTLIKNLKKLKTLVEYAERNTQSTGRPIGAFKLPLIMGKLLRATAKSLVSTDIDEIMDGILAPLDKIGRV